MIPVLYNATYKTFTNNGIGGLPDATKCIVTEKRNTAGGYYLEMEYPVTGLHYPDIIPERIIYAAPAPGKKPQPFRINRISKPIDGIIKVEAPHVSSELSSIVTYGSYPVYTVYGGFDTFKQVAVETLWQTVPFTMTSDIDLLEVQRIEFPKPTAFMDVLLGSEGSFLDKIGGEFEWDGWNVILHKQRGTDNGLEIRYGVNMSDMDAETDASELVNAVVPYWSGSVGENDIVVVGNICIAENYNAFSYVRTIPYDVSRDTEVESGTAPTQAQVTAAGQAYISKTDLTDLTMSTTVSYIPITGSIGDRPINLCDTVRVVNPDLGLSSTAKVVETKFNVLSERYESVTIGSIRKSIVDTIADLIKR